MDVYEKAILVGAGPPQSGWAGSETRRTLMVVVGAASPIAIGL
jgi:hypothetical protein